MTQAALILQSVGVDANLLLAMQAAVIVAAVAILVQTGLLVAMFFASRSMKQQVTMLTRKVEPLAFSASQTLELAQTVLGEVRGYAREYAAKGNEILDLTRTQLGRVDELMSEAATRTRTQMDRIEMVIDDTVGRFQETTALLQHGVVKPLRQIAGVTAGVRTMFAAIFGARRTSVERATQDDEMFI